MKNGKLSNVVPIPVAKLSAVTARSNVLKSISKKETIHDIIEEYNALLQLSKMEKSRGPIGIRGHQFTKSPTLE